MPSRRDEARALFRNAVLEAAEEVFAERGFHGARIQDIAERARIAVGTIYNHFEQKEDVLRALLEERTEELVEQLAPSPADPTPFDKKLVSRIARMLRFMEQHRGFFLIATDYGLIGASSQAAAAILGRPVRHMDRMRSAFTALMEEGIQTGALEGVDPALLSRIFGGILRGFVVGALHDGTTSLEEHAPFLVRVFLKGAGQRKRGAPARAARAK